MLKMTKYFLCFIFCIFATIPAFATPCVDFNTVGAASSADDFTNTKPTAAQIELFKNVIGNHVADISSLGASSKRKKALELIIKNGKLVWFVSNSLSMTRDGCLRNPKQEMDDLAIDNFNFLIDAAAEKL